MVGSAARARRGDDDRASVEDLDEVTRHGAGVAVEAGVVGGLAAARLSLREVHADPQPPQQTHGVNAHVGEEQVG